MGWSIDHEIRDGKKSLTVLELGQKRQVVMQLIETYPIPTVCQVLNYPRSQVYYRPQAANDDCDLKGAILTLAGQYPTYGYRRTSLAERLCRTMNENH